MGARKTAIKAVEVDGITVKINLEYMQSWDGVMQAAEMQRAVKDGEASEGEQFIAVLDYYTNVIVNIDDVCEALGGGSVPASDVFAVLGKAMAAVSAKN